MDIIQILILGILQGITEWLPISSKTIAAFSYLMMGGQASKTIPILLYLHLGTSASALVYFRKKIIQIIYSALKTPPKEFSKNPNIAFYLPALAATGAIGLPLLYAQKIFFESIDASLLFALMGAGLVITSILLYTQKRKKGDERQYASASIKDGLFCGILQGFSSLPGISRSGSSTTALVLSKFSARATFELSFILSIPTVLAAEALFYLLDANFASFPLTDGLLLALFSFIFGLLTIGTLLKIAKRINLSTLALAFGILMILASFANIS